MIPCDSEDENIPRKPKRIKEDGNLLWHANRMVDDLKQLSHLLNASSVLRYHILEFVYTEVVIFYLMYQNYVSVMDRRQYFKAVYCFLVFSGKNLEAKVSSIQVLYKKLQSGKGRIEPFIRDVCLNNDAAAGSWITEDK